MSEHGSPASPPAGPPPDPDNSRHSPAGSPLGSAVDNVGPSRDGAGSEPIELSPLPFTATHDEDDGDGDGERLRGARVRKVALAGVLAVALASCAALGLAGYRISTQKDATLSTPDQVAGLRRDDSEGARTTAEYLRNALAAEVDVERAVGAVYSDPGYADRTVLLFGGTTLLWTPEDDLDTAFELVSDDAGAVTGLHEVPAGDLGGTMKCGTTTSPDGDFAVCGWADHGSLALALFAARPPADAASLLRSIRAGVQTRS